MDDGETGKTKIFMRGEVKNARAEELLALLKEERERKNIEDSDVPYTLKKQPLLPAIQNKIYDKVDDFPIEDTTSQLLWKDLNWENTHRLNDLELSNGKQNFAKNYSINSTDQQGKDLPPLKIRKRQIFK